MKSYLLSAVGVIFFTVLVSFVLPDGRLKKSCSFVLRVVCVCVLIQPAINLFSFCGEEQSYTYDYEYVSAVYSKTQSELLQQKLCESFEVDCECTVCVLFDGSRVEQTEVTVTVKCEDGELIEKITEYLRELGYINISVNEKGGGISQST